MRKTVIDPGVGEQLDAFDDSEVDGLVHSNGVAVGMDGYTRVFLSGVVALDDEENVVGVGDVETQTRTVLETIESYLAELGGGMDDIVRVRVYVDSVADEEFVTVHEVRDEFFDPEHYPASTLVEVESLAFDDLLIEVDADAVVPDDGWDVAAPVETDPEE
ncbi:RidA family protein [Candidatus Halobonum tyrrellensis]|uniref:RidA family protein n=1 Tax=Candidatus Halobonum tyrrellensis TaxID=1431545 RepID=UPI0013764BD5|nr:RidA family protein [Candidatus Halobonum tyrrellensis]